MDIFTVTFFGHRTICDTRSVRSIEERLEELIERLLREKYYVDLLVGRSGDFDMLVSSTIRSVRKRVGTDNSTHALILPYMTAEYKNNRASFEGYYDEVEICDPSGEVYYKSAIQVRNRYMIDRSDLVVCYVEHPYGGAYQAMKYAKKRNKLIVELGGDAPTDTA